MNTRPLSENDGRELIVIASPYSPTERDLVDAVKSTPNSRLAMFEKTSAMVVPAKVDESQGDEQKKRRKKRKKKWTKPAGKPKRPLSAYNIFFAKERIVMLGKDVPTAEQEALKKKVHCKTHGKISFAVMARTIGAKWKRLHANEKKIFEDRAREEKARYLVQLTSWKDSQKNGKSIDGPDADKRGYDHIPAIAGQKCQIEVGSGGVHSHKEVTTDYRPAFPTPDLSAKLPTADMAMPLSHGTNRRNSNLLRILLEEENRSRYMSLLRLQSNQANQCRYPQSDPGFYALNEVPRRMSMPRETIPGPQSIQPYNVDAMYSDRSLFGNLQSSQSPSLHDFNNTQYLQILENYVTIARINQQKRIISAYSNGS
mmetsp:Transcript_5268/g.11025  ORF Transcript_5268/g.11025 Transcript_5268/m.11025 type:complete len:370 (+) Transcript_5268:62-1171(+)